MINIKSKIIAILVTIGVIGVLFLTGPAQAIILSIEIPKTDIVKGSLINIMPSIEIQDSEIVDINYLSLQLIGQQEINCIFFINGSAISGCEGIKIEPIESADFGYGYGYLINDFGYGYGYGFMKGFLKYNITIESKQLNVGRYQPIFSVFSDGEKILEKKGDVIDIKTKIINRLENRCSIRAFDGKLGANNKNFTNNRINFYISSRDPMTGKGALSGQKNRERISYRFKVNKIIENNDLVLKVKVIGEFRIGNNPADKQSAESILVFDRLRNKISLNGGKINTKSMFINFIEGCESLDPDE